MRRARCGLEAERMDHRLLAFLGIAAILIITPGVDMALVTKNALRHGRNTAVVTALGVNVGLLIWTIAAARHHLHRDDRGVAHELRRLRE